MNNKKVYVLIDGSGSDEIFDVRLMDWDEYLDAQQNAHEATDSEFGWLLADTYYAKTLGREGGKSTSDAKREASRENGKKGGRPAQRIYRRGQDVSGAAERAYWSDEIPF